MDSRRWRTVFEIGISWHDNRLTATVSSGLSKSLHRVAACIVQSPGEHSPGLRNHGRLQLPLAR